MKVSKLITLLSGVDPEAEVLISSDAEGNQISPLVAHDPGFFYQENYYFEGWAAEDCCLSKEEWNKMRAGTKAILLSP